VRNCTRDEGTPFEFGNQVSTSSYRKAAAAVICMRSRAGFTPHGFLVSVPAYSRFPEKKVGGPGTKPQARQF
jgi:hypothetical protein